MTELTEGTDRNLPKIEPCSVYAARFLPLHAAVFGTLAALSHPERTTQALALALWGSAFVGLRHPLARRISLALCVCVAASLFPDTPNHGYVLCIALVIGALFHAEKPSERWALDAGYRHLAAIVFFWSGIQKLYAGTWLSGQYFAYLVGHAGRFGIWSWMVDRPMRYAYQAHGPFLGTTTLIVLSNLVWIGEVAVGLGLLTSNKRIRTASAMVAVLLIVGIEVGARESTFGLLMLALLLPTTNARFRAVWLWLLVPFELLAIGGRLGLVPGGFH